MELRDDEPPIGDLLDDVVHEGRRRRTRRRRSAAGAALSLALVGAAATIVALPGGGATAGPAGTASTAGPVGTVGTVGTADRSSTVVTPEQVLAEFLALLPPGGTSNHTTSRIGSDTIYVSTYLTTRQGTGQVDLNVTHAPGSYAGTTGCGTWPYPITCSYRVLADGTKLTIEHNPTECPEASIVTATRKDGDMITVFVQSCLGGGPGVSAPMVLTDAQATAIATNPALGWFTR